VRESGGDSSFDVFRARDSLAAELAGETAMHIDEPAARDRSRALEDAALVKAIVEPDRRVQIAEGEYNAGVFRRVTLSGFLAERITNELAHFGCRARAAIQTPMGPV
jgi:hypothetical protein